MISLLRTSVLSAAIAATLVSGCGGNVNLGGKGSAGSGSDGGAGAAQVSTNPDLSASQPVTMLAKDFSLGTLAVAGDFLYFSGVNAKEAGELYRCRKANCEATRELLTNVSGAIGSLQVFEDRLGVTNYAVGNFWLGSYALPGATDAQIAIGDLPAMNAVSSQFIGSFVYFSLGVDWGIYRCALPDCPNGPERIGLARAAPGGVHLCADAQHVFWTDRTLIYRAADYGHEPARTLLPDAELSEAPAGSMRPEGDPVDDVEAMTAGEGFLYAALNDAETGAACGAACPRRIVRWPSSGGPSEVLFSTEARLQRLFFFEGELAWISLAFQPSGIPAGTATVSTCRVEACQATRRDLGNIGLHSLVADDRDLYWLQAQVVDTRDSPGSQISIRQIRRAPRLPAP